MVVPDEEEPEVEPEPQPLLIPELSMTEGPNEKDLLIERQCQENRALRIELQSFKSKAQKVVKRRWREESRSRDNCHQKEQEQAFEQAYRQV